MNKWLQADAYSANKIKTIALPGVAARSRSNEEVPLNYDLIVNALPGYRLRPAIKESRKTKPINLLHELPASVNINHPRLT